MSRISAFARALAIVSGIPLVVFVAQSLLAILGLSPADALSLDALASAATLALFAFAAATLGGARVAVRLGLGAGRFSYARIAIGAFGALALSHAAEGVLAWSGATSPGLARFDAALTRLPLREIAFPFVALVLASACGEELFFRGLLQRGLAPVLGRGVAIALAAIAFGAAHGDVAHAAAAALLGLYLGALADAADSIRPAMFAHAMNNAAALIEVAAELRIPDGPAATPLAVVIGLTLACVALAAVRRGIHLDPVLQSRSGAAD